MWSIRKSKNIKELQDFKKKISLQGTSRITIN